MSTLTKVKRIWGIQKQTVSFKKLNLYRNCHLYF